MIFHASIGADNPEHVAGVLARIWKGEAFRFPPWPGAFVAMAGDERGSTIEVYPRSNAIGPGEKDEMCKPHQEAAASRYSPFHLAIASELGAEEIMAIGAQEGWRAVRCARGGIFEVIELWIENAQMIEVLTPDMQRAYKAGVNLNTWRWTKAHAASAPSRPAA